MELINIIFRKFSAKEKKVFLGVLGVLVFALVALVSFIIKDQSEFIPIAGGSYTEGVVGQPITLNPILSANGADQELSALLYAPLGKLLAASSTTSDGKIYTLELKDDLKWSDGKNLTSDDVVFTIQTIQDYNAHSPLYQSWKGISVEKVSRVQVKLTIPSRNVFFADAIQSLPVVPRHIYGPIPVENLDLSVYKLKPVGSGPYKVKDFSKRSDGFITEYRLVPNPYWNGAAPLIPNFSFQFFETIADVAQALAFHQVNGFASFWPLGFDSSSLKGFTIDKLPGSNYYAAFFNQNNNAMLKDQNVRQALVSAVDQSTILGNLPGSDPKGITGPALLASLRNRTSTFNAASAASLIAKYKEKNKIASTSVTLSAPNVDFLQKVATTIQNEWRGVGIDNVSIQTVDVNDPLNSPLKTRNYDVFLFGNVLKNEGDLFPFWHSSQAAYPGLNLSLYASTAADKLMEKIRATTDDASRLPLLMNLENTIVNDNPAVFLFSLPYYYVHSSELRGFASGTITTPADLYNNVSQWSIAKVRVIK